MTYFSSHLMEVSDQSIAGVPDHKGFPLDAVDARYGPTNKPLVYIALTDATGRLQYLPPGQNE